MDRLIATGVPVFITFCRPGRQYLQDSRPGVTAGIFEAPNACNSGRFHNDAASRIHLGRLVGKAGGRSRIGGLLPHLIYGSMYNFGRYAVDGESSRMAAQRQPNRDADACGLMRQRGVVHPQQRFE
jgi:hypothetical protein